MRAFIVLFFIFLSAESFAGVIKWNNQSFKMNYSNEWDPVQNFMGIPVTFFGPFANKKVRSIIQLIPTEAKELSQSQTEINSFNKKWPEEKKTWLKKRNGYLLSLLPAGIEELNKKEKMIVAGASYRLGDYSFMEKNFYVNCRKKVVQMKIMIPLGDNKAFDTAEKIVRSFECAD